MKKRMTIFRVVLFASIILLFSLTLMSFVKDKYNEPKNTYRSSNKRVSFNIKGTGSKGIDVKIGIGYQIGSGACCSTISSNTTGGFIGEVGDLVYDSERKRVIVKINEDLEGQTIDLKDYY